MKLFIIFIVLSNFVIQAQDIKEMEDIYIHEVTPKIMGAYCFVFESIDSLSNIASVVYKVTIRDSKVIEVKKDSLMYTGKWEVCKNGIVKSHGNSFFSSSNYLVNKRFSDEVYNAISKEYFKGTNVQRKSILEKFVYSE